MFPRAIAARQRINPTGRVLDAPEMLEPDAPRSIDRAMAKRTGVKKC
jgi:hypothetical protein